MPCFHKTARVKLPIAGHVLLIKSLVLTDHFTLLCQMSHFLKTGRRMFLFKLSSYQHSPPNRRLSLNKSNEYMESMTPSPLNCCHLCAVPWQRYHSLRVSITILVIIFMLLSNEMILHIFSIKWGKKGR